jgi:hypothetical protein
LSFGGFIPTAGFCWVRWFGVFGIGYGDALVIRVTLYDFSCYKSSSKFGLRSWLELRLLKSYLVFVLKQKVQLFELERLL